jgi:hypothetical protein
VKAHRMRRKSRIKGIQEMRNAYKMFVGDPQGKRQLETWEDNADIYFFNFF